MEFERIDPEARREPSDGAKNIIVFILGEAARAENFSLNGYARDTNPELAKRDVISFSDVAASGTSTAMSVPVMFSHKTRGYSVDRLEKMENVVDLLKQAGYDVLWYENDDGCKGVCARVKTVVPDPKTNPEFCDGTTCHDEVMLEGFEERLRGFGGDAFVAFHIIGSHGPAYYKRYPKEFEKFTPTCETSELQDCARGNIVNTYDNTILYTDYFIGRVIDVLKKFPKARASVIYVSDHGESLGENGIYLHGMPYAIAPEQQRKVPMTVWMNDAARKYIDYDCLKSRRTEELSHDNLFHSVLGLAEVQSKLYEKGLDIFAGCAKN
jgi:lipid A ethanolaminephosphotransferase